MKKVAFFLVLLVFAACQSGGPSSGSSSVPGHGAITVEVQPNPIVATAAAGDQYDFPFDVIVRETGGHALEISRVTATVRAPGGFTVATETYDAARIRSLGYSTTIPANGELRYRFTPRKSVPDERLFGGVSAELRVDARDASGTATSGTTTVTVRKG